MEGISVQVDQIGTLSDIALLRVGGYVDTTTSPELQQRLFQLIQEGSAQFIVDLASVQYVSSAGWGVFVGEIRGLRERGGDLKIIHMTPEVYEVFAMLEFDRILAYHDSLEEALDDFEYARGLDLTAAVRVRPPESVPAAPIQPAGKTIEKKSEPMSSRPGAPRNRDMNDADLPLAEKIKKLVVENPAIGAWSIKKTLYSPRFGYTKIGYFKLRGLLKRLGLNNRRKRYRYYRSR
ncbi:STAS domain-containing protein [candidate division KSB1 bacterium]|nr:STAS domain-containing protein [candidate division KSB1 bacterium]